MNSHNRWQPFIYALLIAAGLALGIWLKPAGSSTFGGNSRLDQVLHMIDAAYVDSVDIGDLEENSIAELLSRLDPHSVFIPASDLKRSNEELDGSFEGIGIEFGILDDTVIVINPIDGGPSQLMGIQSGDRLLSVNGETIAGIGISNDDVLDKLRGEEGTQVRVGVYRPGVRGLKSITITRGNIPIYSIDVKMMLDAQTGYIKVNNFSATTHEEFTKALSELRTRGMKQLVLDLRRNPGGYLEAVSSMADEFLDDNKLIVYTEGRAQARKDYTAGKTGSFEQDKLIVLIDEESASASEIMAGAVQDHDRGIIIGRRSFGKGLVQEPYVLSDNSAIRLTVARYYTPSGRCIQKPYEDYRAYQEEVHNRYTSGELIDSSRYHLKDSTVYRTRGGRVVYGGGGIMPDIFVPIDTSYQTAFLSNVLEENLINQFAVFYADRNRNALKQYKNAGDFNQSFHAVLLFDFLKFAAKKGFSPDPSEIKASATFLEEHLKASVARQRFRTEGYFTVLNSTDPCIKKAMGAFTQYDDVLKAKK